MMDPVPLLKRFCKEILENKDLPSPVQIELFDIGMNPTYEMEARIDDEGKWSFSKERLVPGTMWRTLTGCVSLQKEGIMSGMI